MLGKKKKGSVIEPKAGDKYITMNEGLSGEYKVKVLPRQPKGWTPIKGALTAPKGYIWVSNNKSILKGERQTALIKDKSYPKSWETPGIVKIMPSPVTKSAKKQPKAAEQSKSLTPFRENMRKTAEARDKLKAAGYELQGSPSGIVTVLKVAKTKELSNGYIVKEYEPVFRGESYITAAETLLKAPSKKSTAPKKTPSGTAVKKSKKK